MPSRLRGAPFKEAETLSANVFAIEQSDCSSLAASKMSRMCCVDHSVKDDSLALPLGLKCEFCMKPGEI